MASGGSTLADFSSAGPTPLSLRLKPDISAPGVSILSSVPGDHWEAMSGTSMATPQIAGAAALLLERHPNWTVADLKAALIETGSSVKDGEPDGDADSRRRWAREPAQGRRAARARVARLGLVRHHAARCERARST